MRNVDLERWVRDRFRVLNESGTKGYDKGVRVIKCPLCDDERGRGWVQGWGAGCFNAGCDAQPKLPGGIVELARRVEKLESRGEVWRFLQENYGTDEPLLAPEPKPFGGDDFVRFPPGSRAFVRDPQVPALGFQRTFVDFASRQWGVGLEDLISWGCLWTGPGPVDRTHHPWRLVIPILLGGVAVAWQARSAAEAEPKYLTSSSGHRDDPEAECGRPASCLLFNLDAVRPDEEVVLVEGPGDVLGWHRGRRSRTPTAVAILGMALGQEKLSLLRSKRPGRVLVALDDEPEAQERAAAHVEDLRAWEMDATLGRWVGGKDAGEGAGLEENSTPGPLARVRERLGRV